MIKNILVSIPILVSLNVNSYNYTSNNRFDFDVKIKTKDNNITAKFMHKDLNDLAKKLGYDHFNWVSYVESDPHGIKDTNGNILTKNYIDPPYGGYSYSAADHLPFYWDMVDCNNCSDKYAFELLNNKNELVFYDAPSDYRLTSNESIKFVTYLVGVTNYDTKNNIANWTVLNAFRWELKNVSLLQNEIKVTETNINLNTLNAELLEIMVKDGALIN